MSTLRNNERKRKKVDYAKEQQERINNIPKALPYENDLLWFNEQKNANTPKDFYSNLTVDLIV